MKWQDIARLSPQEFNKLDAQTLRKYTNQMVSAANKRIRTLNKKGLSTPALAQLDEERFSVKRAARIPKGTPRDESLRIRGEEINQLRATLAKARGFMRERTSTVKGYQEFVKDFVGKINGFERIPKDEQKKMSRAELREYNAIRDERLKRFAGVDWGKVWKLAELMKRHRPVMPSDAYMRLIVDTVENHPEWDTEQLISRIDELMVDYESMHGKQRANMPRTHH